MGRLTEIVDNHDHLNDLVSILKHYAVSAEFVTFALIEQFTQKNEDDQGSKGDDQGSKEDEESTEVDQQYTTELIEDLNHFYTRF
jgi:hypothetical protein